MALNIISKKNVHPIILPILSFTDIYGQFNAYFEMNPSINIDKDGNVIILVRNVDYRIFAKNKFTIYNNPTNSLYIKMTGKIDEEENINLENFTLENINYNYPLPKYSSFWTGMEDIRFINSSDLLITIPELNPSGNPCIFKGILSNNQIHSFIQCFPNTIEKNWMPFTNKNGDSSVIYSLSPFIIKSIESDDFVEIKLNENISYDLKDYHGSTNGIQYKDNCYLFLIHVSREKSYHRWLEYNIFTNEVNISKEFVFFQYSYIEFSTSLCFFKNRIFVSLGVNDMKAFIIELSLTEIEKCL